MDQEKTNIRYLRVILTNICNLNCMGCHQEGQTCYDEITEFDLMKIITSCIHVGVRKVKLMGGEPTLRNDLLKIIHNIKNIDKTVDLSLISNGTAEIELYNMCFYKGLDRLNISIHGFGLEYFLLNTNSTELLWKKMRSNLDILCLEKKINKLNYVLKKHVNERDLLDLIAWLSQYPNIRLDVLNYLTTNDKERCLTYSMKDIEIFLDKNFGIINKKKIKNDFSLESIHVVLKNGVIVNLKTSELRNANFLKSCANCMEKEYCREGISAVRLCTDYKIQPCLFRNDNCFFIKPYFDQLDSALLNYFINI